MGNNFLIALCGRSGAGKSTVADRLKDLMQWNVVESYIVDFPGIKELKQKYPGDKKIVVIYLDAPTEILIERMRRRGDSEEKIEKRIKNDDQMFHEREADIDLLIDARKPINEVVQEIIDYIYKCTA